MEERRSLFGLVFSGHISPLCCGKAWQLGLSFPYQRKHMAAASPVSTPQDAEHSGQNQSGSHLQNLPIVTHFCHLGHCAGGSTASPDSTISWRPVVQFPGGQFTFKPYCLLPILSYDSGNWPFEITDSTLTNSFNYGLKIFEIHCSCFSFHSLKNKKYSNCLCSICLELSITHNPAMA